MERIAWCIRKKEGIRIIEPDREISTAYLERSRSDFLEIKKQNKTWKVIISYYECYNAIYAVLARYGIKSEIHSCTIDLMRFFKRLSNHRRFMVELKEMRHDTQYYLKQAEGPRIDAILELIGECEKEIVECNQEKIEALGRKLRSIPQD